MNNFYKPIYATIKQTCKYYLRNHFKTKYDCLSKYEDQIVILAVFLFIISTFIFKTKKEKDFDFDWKSYFYFYKPGGTLVPFIVCSIRYLLDIYSDMENKDKIIANIPDLKSNFIDQYEFSFLSKFKNIDRHVDLSKYPHLLELVLKIHNIHQYEIRNDKSKVLDLVNYTTQCKQIVFEIFKYKAEYIMFSFFINLSR
ncbi:hypothetical protein [Candidatus Mycoplasma haematohominis]|uniref:Uncharacterized protein n=1 Tax=Candidatus Mycoplasma haematohominis TaxID=1494318 RepID=A0A478FQT2_9MOLU|nr:hypothetical protein [Candidatus Mycoplasma haemohominis]GCE63304.1 hypothetical protein MHSWG343_02930 [Candidatus Mycoplasma haemohominis]